MKAITTFGFGSVVLSLALVACPTPTPPTPPPVAVSRVVLETKTLVLENIGATQQLFARALDAQGNPVAASISFESSKPGNVGVDAGGLATGVAVGSSQLRAVSGGVKSAPIIAMVGSLNDGVARIANDKIVSGPNFPEGVALFSVGSTYTAVVKEITPTTGKLWFSKAPDGTPVQGKIVSSRAVANGTEVTFEIVPIAELFKALSADEEISFSSDEITVPESMRQHYSVQKDADGSLTFTPKSADSLVKPLAFDVGPFSCKGTIPETAFALGTPSLTLNLGNPTWQFVFDAPIPFVSAGRLRMFFRADPSLRINSGTHSITTNFNNQNVTCKYKPGIKQSFSVYGIGLTAKLTPGITIGGSFGAGTLGFSARLNAQSNVRLGFDCRPPAGCSNLTSGNPGTVRGSMTMNSLGNLAQTIRDLKLGAFADVTISADTPIGDLILFGFGEGYEMNFDLAPLSTQISQNNSADYALERYLKVDPFAVVKDFVKFFLGSSAANSLGLDPIRLTEAAIRSPLISAASITAQNPQLGARVSVQLDPNRINFFNTVSPFGLLYNVGKVQLIGVRPNGTTEILDETTPASGATSATLSASLLVWNNFSNHYVTVVPVVLDGLPVGGRMVQ